MLRLARQKPRELCFPHAWSGEDERATGDYKLV